MNFTAIDFETANQQRNSACSVGLVNVRDGRIVDQAVYLIKPPSNYFAFTHIHGLTWGDVCNSPTFKELWSKENLSQFFLGSDFIAAHNAPFDKSVLIACCNLYGITPPNQEFKCTVKLSKQKWNLNPAKLSDVANFLGIELSHHEALSDAIACAKIMLAINNLPYK